jgi:hypothetical protein
MPPSSQRATSIKGRKISLFENNPTFILLLCTLLVMVVLYLLDIYNSGPFLFGMVAYGAYYYIPKEWNDVYEYIFVVTVDGVSKQFSCISNEATININYIIPKINVFIAPHKVESSFYIKAEIIKLIMASDNLTGLFPFDLNCFTKAVSDDGRTITYTIKSDVTVRSLCNTFVNVISKGNVPIIRSSEVSIK